MKIRPSSAQAARYSPFSVTLAWVQVRPDRYQTTGSLPAPAWGGRKIEKVMLVEVADEAWRTTSCRPPCDLASLTISRLTRPSARDRIRTACCRPDRANRPDTF